MPSQPPQKKRVLVVEDDPLLAMSLVSAFRDAGAGHVSSSSRAATALDEMCGTVPDLLVLDVALDDSELGYGLAEIAHQLFHPPPAVVFSTGDPDRIPAHVARLGTIFAKPYDPDQLACTALAAA